MQNLRGVDAAGTDEEGQSARHVHRRKKKEVRIADDDVLTAAYARGDQGELE